MADRKTILTPSVMIGIKVFLLFIMVLIMQAPLYTIRSLISERETRSEEAENEVIRQFGGQQIISGPVLVLTYSERIEQKNPDKVIYEDRQAFFTPEDLQIKVDMKTEIRHRGIFEIPVYTVAAKMEGFFEYPDLEALNISEDRLIWEKSYITYDLADMRGLGGIVVSEWNDRNAELDGGVSKSGIMAHSLFFKSGKMKKGEVYTFGLNLNLRGGHQLDFIAMGKESRISINADWPGPSFNGSRLPDSHTIDDNGFSASWAVLALTRNFPENWTGDDLMNVRIANSKFGFTLYSPVDHYLLSERSIKYGLLFIILPFICFFLFETVWKLRIHFFQYLLVGICELVFFLLLLSFSEHIGFNFAFLIAALLTVAAISYYANVFVKDRLKTLFISALLTISFIFLFVIIQNEDYALLIGSSGIFLIVVLVMLVTRKVDWYQLGKNISGSIGPGDKLSDRN